MAEINIKGVKIYYTEKGKGKGKGKELIFLYGLLTETAVRPERSEVLW